MEDSAKYRRENELNLEKVAELVENAKKDIEREYQERMMEMLENTAAR